MDSPRPDDKTHVATTERTLFGDVVVVQDDGPLWLAWETAREAWLNRQGISAHTATAYGTAARQFFQWAGVAPWQVSSALAQDWVHWMAQERLSEATITQKLAALTSFFTFCQRRYTFRTPQGREVTLWPADQANPFATVARPKVTRYGRAIYPSAEELRAILGAIRTQSLLGKRDFALLFTLATTCRRSSEILNLRWGDIEPMADGHYCFTYRCKGGDTRKAVLNRAAFQAICVYLTAAKRPPDTLAAGDYVFAPCFPERVTNLPGRDARHVRPNRPISNSLANRILKKYASRVGVAPEKAHLHGLRHAGARLRVQQMKANGGVDYMQLMELLGHSSLAVTQIYSQTVLEGPRDPGGEAAAAALFPGKRRDV